MAAQEQLNTKSDIAFICLMLVRDILRQVMANCVPALQVQSFVARKF